MRRTQKMMQVGRLTLHGLMVCAGLFAGSGLVASALAAEPDKSAEEAGAIESRLLDLQIQAGVLNSLQGNAEPVDTGVLAERQTTTVMPGAQDAQAIARIDGEIRGLVERYRKLTGRGAGILPKGTQSRRIAASTLVARAPAPVNNSAPVAGTPGAGGWAGTTTVAPGYGQSGGVGAASNQAAPGTGGWGAPQPASPWAPATGAGDAPVYGQGSQAYGGQGGAGQPSSQSTTGGWGDTSDGRVGEVLPPGVPYPGSGNGSYSDALAGLDQARRQPAPQAVPQTAPSPGVSTGSDLQGAEAAYEKAYGYLLQQDYGASQFAFREFLARHPKSPLAGNAQYWLGEIHYVQGQYREAARAFLSGYERYGDGNKAADSLLKLALSLDQLNQAKAACSSLSEFFKRYGQAGDAPVEQANQARQRLRCRS